MNCIPNYFSNLQKVKGIIILFLLSVFFFFPSCEKEMLPTPKTLFKNTITANQNGIFIIDAANLEVSSSYGSRISNGISMTLSESQINTLLYKALKDDLLIIFSGDMIIEDGGTIVCPNVNQNGEKVTISYTDKSETSEENFYAEIIEDRIHIRISFIQAVKVYYATESMSYDAELTAPVVPLDKSEWCPLAPVNLSIKDLGSNSGVKIYWSESKYNMVKPDHYLLYGMEVTSDNSFTFIANIPAENFKGYYIDNSHFARSLRKYDIVAYKIYGCTSDNKHKNGAMATLSIYGRSW